MSKTLYAEMTVKDRVSAMTNLASEITTEEYGKRLSDDELHKEQKAYTQEAIELQNLEVAKKKAVDEHQSKIKAQQAVMDERLEIIKTGRRKTTGKLYHIPDRNKGLMVLWDETGEEIDSRPLSSSDHQDSLFLGNGENEDDPEVQDVEFEEVEEPKNTELTEEEINELYDDNSDPKIVPMNADDHGAGGYDPDNPPPEPEPEKKPAKGKGSRKKKDDK